jgi:ATP-dependent helicase/nuclease subunit B
MTPDERLALTEECAREYIKSFGEEDIDSPATRMKIERLKMASRPIVDTLAEELESSKFIPSFFELPIGKSHDGAAPDAITYKEVGGDIHVYGIVDRVDTYKTEGGDLAVRVIDYKTGSKEFSPEDIKEGKNLQMFLYLKAICDASGEEFRQALGVEKDGKIIPAGVIYVKTSLSDVTIDRPSREDAERALRSAQKREGMVLDNDEVISAMGLKYTPLYSEKKPDEISASKREYLYSEESWGTMMSDIEGVVRDVVSRMRSGDISANPRTQTKGAHTPCEYCNFRAVCRNVRTK